MTKFSDAKHINNLEHKIDTLTTSVAHSDMHNEETRKEFIQIIRDIRESNYDRFTDGVWRRVNHQLDCLHDHHENQIAQGVLTQLKEAVMNE